MRVAVIVLDHFGATRTAACLRALRGEPLDSVYVVDNSDDAVAAASLDTALAVLRDEQPGPRIERLRADRNLGFAAGVNFALAADRASAAPHDFYLLINNDAVPAPGMLTALLEGWRLAGPRSVVGPEVLDGRGGSHREVFYQRYLGLFSYVPRRGFFQYLSGCCLGVPAGVLDGDRLFDADFFMYGEETALGWALLRRGVAMRCVPAARVTHDAGNRFGVYGMFYEYHMTRAHLLLACKTWRTRLEVPLLLAVKLPVLALRAVWRALRYRSAAPLQALAMAPFRVTVRARPRSAR